MPQIILNIPDAKFDRFVNSVLVRKGYVFNPELGSTELEQQISAAKTHIIQNLKDDVLRQEFTAFRESNTFNLNDAT